MQGSASLAIFAPIKENKVMVIFDSEGRTSLTINGHPGVAADSIQSIAVDAFFNGCNDKLAAMIVMGSKPQTLAQAVSRLRDAIEDQIVLDKHPYIKRDSLHKSSSPTSLSTTNPDENFGNMITEAVLKVLDVKNDSHTVTRTHSKSLKLCFTCGVPGHFARECPNRTNTKNLKDKHRKIICFHCGETGHFARVCEQRPPRDIRLPASSVRSNTYSECGHKGDTWKDYGRCEQTVFPSKWEGRDSVVQNYGHAPLKSNKDDGNRNVRDVACDHAEDVVPRRLCSACSMCSSSQPPVQMTRMSSPTNKHQSSSHHPHSEYTPQKKTTECYCDSS